MGNLGTDGRPYSPEDTERLEQALVALLLDLRVRPWTPLTPDALLDWHAQLSANLSRMQPGHYRTADLTFGTYFGTSPQRIPHEVQRLLRTVNIEVRRSEQSDDEQAHLHRLVVLSAWLHGELIRIHPVWDGNGRLARAAQAALLWGHGLDAPRFQHRPMYLAALNRHLRGDPDALVQLTLDSLPR